MNRRRSIEQGCQDSYAANFPRVLNSFRNGVAGLPTRAVMICRWTRQYGRMRTRQRLRPRIHTALHWRSTPLPTEIQSIRTWLRCRRSCGLSSGFVWMVVSKGGVCRRRKRPATEGGGIHHEKTATARIAKQTKTMAHSSVPGALCRVLMRWPARWVGCRRR